jgi:hypothetical protein
MLGRWDDGGANRYTDAALPTRPGFTSTGNPEGKCHRDYRGALPCSSNNDEFLEVAGVKFQDGFVTPIRSDVHQAARPIFILTSAGAPRAVIDSSGG